MKTILTTAAVALALTGAAVAAPKALVPADMQGDYCLSETHRDGRKDYMSKMESDDCGIGTELNLTQYKWIEDTGRLCYVQAVKRFDVIDAKRGKNPWGQGAEVTMRCYSEDNPVAKISTERWYLAKGYLVTNPVRR